MTNHPDDKHVILVVDDEVGPRESLKMILEPAYTVITANNGKEGIILFEEKSPDMVISDIRMPHMTGVELMKAVKTANPDVPMVLITGYGTLETAQEAVRAGAADYISKPYDVAEIRRVVKNALAEGRKKRETSQTIMRLQQMNTELEQHIRDLDKKASIGDLSAEMIHDLNNPMSILRGYIALLEDSLACSRQSGGNEGEEKEFLDIIKEQIDRCMRLTQNFLDYARNANRKWEAEDINSIIEDALFVLRVRMRSANIELETEFAPDLPETWVQATPLQQVFYNLVSNAVEAMASIGGGNLQIQSMLLESDSASPMIRVSIRDTGPGIPPEIVSKIFTPFFTTKPKGKGTGLGLSICKRVVEEHQGRISVEVDSDQGTCFHVDIPILQKAPEWNANNTGQGSGTATSTPSVVGTSL